MTTPALLGDARGVYRIRIVGNSGAGKSTAARAVGARLGLAVLHLDELHWRCGPRPPALFFVFVYLFMCVRVCV